MRRWLREVAKREEAKLSRCLIADGGTGRKEISSSSSERLEEEEFGASACRIETDDVVDKREIRPPSFLTAESKVDKVEARRRPGRWIVVVTLECTESKTSGR
mmetsp:Transcript_10677/g.14782  ORF Transcript_10677/g.14782 Transcript_10677/m.14782 type:complete len:103 (-) Transcript_10677:211-519(-)